MAGVAFHSGVLAALAQSTGWDARQAALIVGTSAGSVTASGLRAGLSPDDQWARVRGTSLSAEGAALLARADAVSDRSAMSLSPRLPFGVPASPGVLLAAGRRLGRVRPGAVMAGLLPPGTIPTGPIAAGVDALHAEHWPEGTWVCAVRLHDGRLTVFGRAGSPPSRLGQAVAASCAIPAFFAPVEIDGVRYVDGGAHSVTNLATVRGEQLDLVVVSAPMSRTGARLPGLAGLGREMMRAQLALEARAVQRRGIPVIAFSPTAEDQRVIGPNPMDPSRQAAVAEQAHRSTLRRLERPDARERLEVLGAA